MNLKVIKVFSVFMVFIICIPFHFLYDVFPYKIFSIFFPVNESIWEHMKMISSSFLFWSLFEYIIIKKNKIKINNYLFNIFVIICLSVIIFLIIYLPIYNLVGDNLIVTLILLFISILITEIISYMILKYKKNYKYLNIISVILIIILYIYYGYLTYNPIFNDLFLDKIKNIYGINTYRI